MREGVLRDFFLDKVSARSLERDVRGSVIRHDSVRSSVKIEDMDEDFEVTRPMLLKLCDAVISGELQAESLGVIGFALAASDRFHWDADNDELVTDVINDWSCPEVNYPLTMENVRWFRKWLLNEEEFPVKPPLSDNVGNVISLRQKYFVGKWKKKIRKFLENLR